MDLGRFLASISWDQLQRIRTTREGQLYSFAVETREGEQNKKRIVTLGVGDKSTTLTISDPKGRILAHAVQEGGQLVFYSPKTGKPTPADARWASMAPVKFKPAPTADPQAPTERGI